MNKNQTIVAIVVVSIMFAMLLFPPFESIQDQSIFNLGYSFIFMPPGYLGTGTVNIGLILMQWVVVIVGGAIGWFILKDKN